LDSSESLIEDFFCFQTVLDVLLLNLARGVKRRSLQPTISTTSSTDSQYEYVEGSFMERAGASMEKALESFFTAWGTCKSL
jgi:hypothetical protein